MGDFHQILDRIENRPGLLVLATITEVKGSAYRKAGASMLIIPNEKSIGMLSGGCLERDLELRAEQWFSLPKDEFEQWDGFVLNYDMRSELDSGWGRGSGCNGVISVLIEPVNAILRHQLIQLKHQLDRGMSAVSLRIIEEDRCKKRVFVFEDGRIIGDKQDFLMIFPELNYDNFIEEQNVSGVFQMIHRIKPKLVIFGAGDDAIPLSELAVKSGWSVTVADYRAALCNQSRFPYADLCHVAEPTNLLANLPIKESDAVIVMSHDFQVDAILLHALLERECVYIGVLGPLERTKRLLRDAPWPSRLHAPVGLSIGAEGPEEIAVSIMAELIQVYRKALRRIDVACGT
ncbi:MAG: XdhC family protein [Tuberibacillus sp.]